MKKLVLMLACVALFASCNYQDADDFIKYRSAKVTVTCTGNILEQPTEIKGVYDEIEVYDDINVVVTNEVSQPTIVADEALIEHIVLKIQDNSLLVAYNSPIKMEGPSSSPILKLPEMGKVNSVELNGEASFCCVTPWSATSFELSQSGASNSEVNTTMIKNKVEVDLSGSSTASLQCNVNELDVEMSGACSLNLKGMVQKFDLEMSGATSTVSDNVEGVYGFTANVADIELAGSAEVFLNCLEQMKVEASGSSVVNYTGTPQMTQEISGAASVKSLQ